MYEEQIGSSQKIEVFDDGEVEITTKMGEVSISIKPFYSMSDLSVRIFDEIKFFGCNFIEIDTAKLMNLSSFENRMQPVGLKIEKKHKW